MYFSKELRISWFQYFFLETMEYIGMVYEATMDYSEWFATYDLGPASACLTFLDHICFILWLYSCLAPSYRFCPN